MKFTRLNQRVVQETIVGNVKTQKVTGNAQATVTNQSTGKSVDFNISGPGTIVTNLLPNGDPGSFSVDAAGPNLLWTARENLANFPDVPEISYTTGHVTFAVDASGQTTSYNLAGRRTDVCAGLAP